MTDWQHAPGYDAMLKGRSLQNFKVVLLVARPLDGGQPPGRS